MIDPDEVQELRAEVRRQNKHQRCACGQPFHLCAGPACPDADAGDDE